MDGAVPRVTVSLASPESASDGCLVDRLVSIVNAAYSACEGSMFTHDYQRTNAAEVAQFLRLGEMVVATLWNDDAGTAQPTVIGCVRMQTLSPTHGEFGMLALDGTYKGRGYGRDLVVFAADECRRRGRTIMQVELLFPMWFEHATKLRLEKWYQRLGYELVKTEPFQQSYPHLAPLLRGECEFRVYEKALVC